MAVTNFILTVVGVGAVALLLKQDLRRSSAMLRRNLKHIRTWLEEEGTAAEKSARSEVQQLSQRPKSDGPPQQQQPPKDSA